MTAQEVYRKRTKVKEKYYGSSDIPDDKIRGASIEESPWEIAFFNPLMNTGNDFDIDKFNEHRLEVCVTFEEKWFSGSAAENSIIMFFDDHSPTLMPIQLGGEGYRELEKEDFTTTDYFDEPPTELVNDLFEVCRAHDLATPSRIYYIQA